MAYDDEVTAYCESKARIVALVRSLDTAALDRQVPCCPAWTGKELLGHLTGLLEDRRSGTLPAGGFGEWTSAQVARHRDEPVDVVVDTWAAQPLERSDAPPSLLALAFDAVTHEHDLCEAVGSPGDRDTFSVQVGARRAEDRMATLLAGSGAPSVLLRTEDGERRLEGSASSIALRTDRFRLMRLVTGRMSDRQARSLEWDDDPDDVLHALFADGFFTLQPVDVVDR